jgi:hypothetical protein
MMEEIGHRKFLVDNGREDDYEAWEKEREKIRTVRDIQHGLLDPLSISQKPSAAIDRAGWHLIVIQISVQFST